MSLRVELLCVWTMDRPTMPGERPDLQDLIENPPEVFDVELKDWIDIANDRVVQANIARHIAALANHGGGYLFLDSTTVARRILLCRTRSRPTTETPFLRSSRNI